ncbi:hypothetical protein [Serratia marcescens]|uniref:hypothetical protein n=1 Tax=Serratia marcescens TaxID=615 RepID=UPI00217AF2E9|nr:hypothetical protein [Serratia marcescens]CAI1729354.1 Uncharacterised protein [Serratia marcescens]
MYDKIHINDIKSKLNRLKKNNLISPDHINEINHLLNLGDYSEAEEILEDIIKQTSGDEKKQNERGFFNSKYTIYNDEKSSDIDQYLTSLINEKSKLEKEKEKLNNEIKLFRERRGHDLSQLNKKNEELIEITKNFNELKLNYENLASERHQKRIEDKIPEYVKDVSNKLDSDDTLFMDKSQRWSRVGICISIAASFIALYTFKVGFESILETPNIGYVALLFIFFRGVLAIGILSWVALICFNMSSAYIHESILRKDRQHALSFGRLFLQIYGDTATKHDAIEVFKDWNRSGDSAFSKGHKSPPNIFKLTEKLKKENNME